MYVITECPIIFGILFLAILYSRLIDLKFQLDIFFKFDSAWPMKSRNKQDFINHFPEKHVESETLSIIIKSVK